MKNPSGSPAPARFGWRLAREDMHMDIRIRELHYRWIDTPSESVIVDEVPNPEPPPHPQPNDPPPTAAIVEDGGEARE